MPNKYDISSLPELPLEIFELSAKLEHARTAPVLTIKPEGLTATPPDTPSKPVAIPTPEFYVREYLVQVTYPRVICYPPSELANDVVLKPADDNNPMRDIKKLVNHVQYFKLSAFGGAALEELYMCTVHYGPWSAMAIEEQSCIVGVPNRFVLTVFEIPNLVLEWYGTWDDLPSYPSLHVVESNPQPYKEEFFCCPGYKWCATTQSCIDQTLECKDPWQV